MAIILDKCFELVLTALTILAALYPQQARTILHQIYPRLSLSCKRLLSVRFISASEFHPSNYDPSTQCLVTADLAAPLSPMRLLGLCFLFAFGLFHPMAAFILSILLCIVNLMVYYLWLPQNDETVSKYGIYIILQSMGYMCCLFCIIYTLIFAHHATSELAASILFMTAIVHPLWLSNPFSKATRGFRQKKQLIYTSGAFVEALLPCVMPICCICIMPL